MSSDLESSIEKWLINQPGFDAFELVSLAVRRHGKRSFVELRLDRKNGSITLDDCSRWNRVLSTHLEQAGCFLGPF